MLKLKLQYFGHLMRRVDSLEKTHAGRDWGQEEKETTEDEMAGWHHWLDGRESEWTLGVGDGQGGLACCDSWGRKESDMTEWLNWTELWVALMILATSLIYLEVGWFRVVMVRKLGSFMYVFHHTLMSFSHGVGKDPWESICTQDFLKFRLKTGLITSPKAY